MTPFEDRLERLTYRDASGCLIFTGSRNRKGYGYLQFQGKLWQAHRAVWTFYNGAIPEGMQIDHLCKVTSCVTPAHMEVVTPLENRRRREDAQRDTCKRGHPYTGVYGAKGERRCVVCRRASAKRKYREHKAAAA